ncbi:MULTISPECIES: cupin domain-containing protein [unclassified Kribbella]|uniref:cupin domain-containing protein n=1 Tax=unclassified Kribbella TaxID=2644121 RepID=UPI0033DA247E
MTESVHLSTAGTGAEYVAPDATVTVKVGSEHTGAQYEIFEIDAPRGPAAPPHSETWSKAFYVLQGRILVQAGDQGYDLGPGSSISIPAGTVNTFSVLTPSAKFLAVSQTGKMGDFFADLASVDPTDYAALGEVSSRHGVTLAGAPT